MMAQVTPYINFADKGREAIEFYKSVFGGDAEISLVKDSGAAAQMPPEWGERILHLDYKADGVRLMGSDIISDQAGRVVGNTYSLALTCDSEDQLRDWHTKLSVGAENVIPAEKAPWGDESIYGEVTDTYGLRWMMNYDGPKA